MPVQSILEASRSAMAYERARMDAASRNIAGANVPLAPGQVAPRWQAPTVGAAGFESMLQQQPVQTSDPTAFRLVQHPGYIL